MKQIYLDHAAITPVSRGVEKLVEKIQKESYGNPSSLHAKGVEAKVVLSDSRAKVAEILHCRSREVVFTAGGTESTNIAILGVLRKALKASKGKIRPHAITTNIEHHAVLNPFRELESEGVDVTYVKVGGDGLVDAKDMISAIRPETVLISMIYANNEIGTIQPIAAVGRELKKINKQRVLVGQSRILLHSDACQAAGFLDLDTNHLGVDLFTLNGSKIYGPRHSGILFVASGVLLEPIIYGGGQEYGLRSGTEDVAAAAGFAFALQEVVSRKESESIRLTELRDYFFTQVLKKIPNIVINGTLGDHRLPNNLNLSIAGTEGESLVIYLSAKGIYCSTGSACSTAFSEPSHVILAISDNSADRAKTSIRFSLGQETSKKDIDTAVKELKNACAQMRYTVQV